MSYSVLVLPSAERELRKLPHRAGTRVIERIETLAVHPRPVGSRKLSGAADRYRLRVGAYRVLYRIDDSARRIFIYAVGHRKDVYR